MQNANLEILKNVRKRFEKTVCIHNAEDIRRIRGSSRIKMTWGLVLEIGI